MSKEKTRTQDWLVSLHYIEDILYQVLQVDSHIQTYVQLATASNLSEGRIYRLRKKYPEFAVVLEWLLEGEACRSCEAEKIFSKHMEMKTCVGCEETKMCEWGVDPYAYELDDDDTEMWLCGECLFERAGDI